VENGIPYGMQHFRVIYPDLPRSIFLTLFARGSSDAASDYQYCSNLSGAGDAAGAK